MEVQFSIGDKAYYPVHGVAEIVGLENRAIGGSKQSIYVLQIVESGLKIMVPTDKADSVGLREILSPEDVEEVYAILSTKEGGGDSQTWNRRHREYMDKIKTGSAFEIAEVVRDLCLLRNGKDLSFGERRVLDTAKTLLIKEIAQAKEANEKEIDREIESLFAAVAA